MKLSRLTNRQLRNLLKRGEVRFEKIDKQTIMYLRGFREVVKHLLGGIEKSMSTYQRESAQNYRKYPYPTRPIPPILERLSDDVYDFNKAIYTVKTVLSKIIDNYY